MRQVLIIGAGLAGLSAAVSLAEQNMESCLISLQPSERAQSVLAEGGINAAMNVMGESDTTEEHFADTMRGGLQLADPEAVRGLTENAPQIVRYLSELGVPFMMEGSRLVQRNFGGQKKKRTAFCKSSTGKALMTAMIDRARRFEGTLIRRYSHHGLEELILREGICTGVRIRDLWTDGTTSLFGPVILAFGGPNGLFPGCTTGTTANDASGLAQVFSQGVELANLEFIQFHPTTAAISGKRLLISEAARGEGGRLFTMRGGERWYFMEDLYPELGNLMPRDVISREMARIMKDPECGGPIYLDMTGLSADIWKKKLPDLREEIRHYLSVDPAKTPVPVSPGIHFFMGGIRTDPQHRTNIPGLYAAGECACQYHGANRLGGNSLLGALYGGRVAARTAAAGDCPEMPEEAAQTRNTEACRPQTGPAQEQAPEVTEQTGRILMQAMGIVRHSEELKRGYEELQRLLQRNTSAPDVRRIRLAQAVILSALFRKESRGAHQRTDFPDRDDQNFLRQTIARWKDGCVEISLGGPLS